MPNLLLTEPSLSHERAAPKIPEQLRALAEMRVMQLGALTALLAGIGAIAMHLKFSVLDVDLWWHLKVGDWIIEHAAVPHAGILSRSAATRPWVAYSWGYEVLLSRAYAWFGLIGVGVFGTLLTIAVGYAAYYMLLRLSGRFWIACLGAGFTCSVFLFNGMPRPFFFSIILFSLTMTLLLEANRTGRIETLYWLPPIFLLWVNLHIQFIYGLFPVGLLLAVCIGHELVQRMGRQPGSVLPPRLPVVRLGLILAACVLATLIGPNTYHPYISVYQYSQAKFPYKVIIELQPLSFRGFSHFAELLIAGGAFFALGWQKKIDVFKLVLLSVAAVVAFRTMRDAWFLAITAAACIADSLAWSGTESVADHSGVPAPVPAARRLWRETGPWLEACGVGAAILMLLLISASATDFTERALDRAISADFPVNAINFLRRNPVPGPLYNNLNWGGFLMWYMPDYPVVVDGRNDLYGDELDKLFYGTQSADNSYKTDPYLNESGVVLLDSNLPLAKVLTVDPRFQLIYHDNIATVFTRR
jgi:hypothetical protein